MSQAEESRAGRRGGGVRAQTGRHGVEVGDGPGPAAALQLTVPQYSCLELLGQRVDLSSAELARGTFVTRQSMHTLLRDLQERGLVTRAAVAPEGRALPARLTEDGRAALEAASRAVAAVEERMIAPLDAATRRIVLDALRSAVAALEGDASHSAVEP